MKQEMGLESGSSVLVLLKGVRSRRVWHRIELFWSQSTSDMVLVQSSVSKSNSKMVSRVYPNDCSLANWDVMGPPAND